MDKTKFLKDIAKIERKCLEILDISRTSYMTHTDINKVSSLIDENFKYIMTHIHNENNLIAYQQALDNAIQWANKGFTLISDTDELSNERFSLFSFNPMEFDIKSYFNDEYIDEQIKFIFSMLKIKLKQFNLDKIIKYYVENDYETVGMYTMKIIESISITFQNDMNIKYKTCNGGINNLYQLLLLDILEQTRIEYDGNKQNFQKFLHYSFDIGDDKIYADDIILRINLLIYFLNINKNAPFYDENHNIVERKENELCNRHRLMHFNDDKINKLDCFQLLSALNNFLDVIADFKLSE